MGYCVDATDQDIDDALNAANSAHAKWDALGGAARAEILTKVGDLLEQHRVSLMKLVGDEAGRILVDRISEVREAADFCRYYGLQAAKNFEGAQTVKCRP